LPADVNGVPPEAPWRELATLLDENAPEAAFLRRAFTLFCRDATLTAAALYLRNTGTETLRRVCSHGAPRFPDLLAGAPEDDEFRTGGISFRRINFPEGVLLLPAEAREVDSPCALLAAALQLEALRAQLKRQSFQAKYRGVELEALYDVGLAITRTLELSQLADEILLRAVSLLDARRGALYQLEGDTYHLQQAIGGVAARRIAADAPGISTLLDSAASAASLDTAAVQEDTLLPGARFLAAVAIEIENRRWGLLVVADKEKRHGVGPFTEPDYRTLGLFAHQAAIAIANAQLHQEALEKQRLERDMELAAEIQRQLLPDKIPAIEGYSLGGWNRPARQVGGDYYDVRPLQNGRLLLVLGDVTGKGMPAALLVSTLHSALRLMIPRREVGPEFLHRLNEHLLEISPVNKFITLIMVELDRASGRMRYLNAGHNPALLLRRNGQVEELSAGGPPLGLLPDSHYRVQEIDIDTGDLLCLYSDGLTEATNLEDEEFGEVRLTALLNRHRDEAPAQMQQVLESTLHRFTAGRAQGDDQTLILLRRDG
jgi:sigma-B regulation protein RsbU (phosphoserine phosphatase)